MSIDYAKEGRIAVVTLNRPERLNAITPEMFQQLNEIWSDFRDDEDLWVAIVTGAGDRAFCTGRDLVQAASEADGRVGRAAFAVTPDRIWKPVIAAVNGHCLAAGFALALQCDLRIAAEHATFGSMGVMRGLLAGGGQTQRLARYVPFAKAMELMLFGDPIDAREAHRIGLVNAVVPADQVMPTARAWAERLCERGPLAVRATKQALMEGGLNCLFDDGMRLENRLHAQVERSEDAREGVRAFAEKRKPVFRGR
ncbi:MAG TPA: enoyl-CoA hydratase-related protein [Dehalococcoidia bacterium]